MLPATDGGGVVFPFGFFGPVYYLPEWEFIRYGNYIDQLRGQWEALSRWQRRRGRLMTWIAAAFGLLVTVYATRTGVLTVASLPTVVALCLAFDFYYRIIQIYGVQRAKLLSSFDTAVPLPLTAYWWQHSLAGLVAITRRDCFHMLWRWLLRLGIATYIFWAYTRGTMHALLAAAMIPVCALQLIQPIAILASFALMRIWLRRPPTADDLAPVEPPSGKARA